MKRLDKTMFIAELFAKNLSNNFVLINNYTKIIANCIDNEKYHTKIYFLRLLVYDDVLSVDDIISNSIYYSGIYIIYNDYEQYYDFYDNV